MECDILDSLEALGYKGPLLEEDALHKAAEGGLASQDFCELCVWLSSQIQPLCNLEESISSTNGGEDVESLQFEISGFLKELACPYSTLVSGEIKDRLKKKDDCLKVLLFLSTELQALQISQLKQRKGSHLSKSNEVHQEIQKISDVLNIPKSSSPLPVLLSNIESKIKEILSKLPNTYVGKPLLKTPLNPDQMERLEKINDALLSEYECRRRMLMKRLDVTVQSFGWSDRAKVRTDDIAKVYQPKRYGLYPKSSVSLAHLLAAREDLSKIVRTSSGSSREKTICAVNKDLMERIARHHHIYLNMPAVLMGRVPDRGGRPTEIEPPPPEMPPWQKRQDGGGRGGGGRGGWGGGRGGGGRGGGGWGGGGGGGGGGWGGGGRGGGSGGGGGWRGGGGFQGRGDYSGRGGYGDSYGGRGGGGYRRY